MSVGTLPAPRTARYDRAHPRYKWVALSNTTLGVLIMTINSSIVIISLPAIFNGIRLNPLAPGNVSYLLWMIMGFLLISAVLVVSLGRLGDIYGRVRIYNYGFVVFTLASIALALVPGSGSDAALWLIGWRVVQGIGGAMLLANSTAILTDAFPSHQRGMALGINQVAAIAGSFLGLLIGGLLAAWDWHAVFWVNVPIGLIGTAWAFRSLHEVDTTTQRAGRLDWPGNLTFAVGLSIMLAGITYGIQPYGGHATGWTNPWVLTGVLGGVALLVAFCVIESRTAEPMFHLELFRNRAFAAGNAAGLLAAIGRGGLQFMLIIWLQGIWLPLHGYDYASTPLWSGIYLLPLTIGFLIAGPISGYLSDRFGARAFATGGLLLTGASFVGLILLPVDFPYWQFVLLTMLNGIGSGLFSAPNTAAIMNAVPVQQRGAASGMRGTFMNSGTSLSIGIFFSLMVIGLAATLPTTLTNGLRQQGVPGPVAQQIGTLPPVGSLFAAFLGFNPIGELLKPSGVLGQLPPARVDTLTGTQFFPQLISQPFHHGLIVVFSAAAIMMVVAALFSLLRGQRYIHEDSDGSVELGDGSVELGDGSVELAGVSSTAGLAAIGSSLPVRGTVRRPGGGLVSGAALTLVDHSGRQVGRDNVGGDGGFTLSAPDAGGYLLIASAPGYQPWVASVEVGNGSGNVAVVLAGSSGVTGTVRVAGSDQAVAGALVTLTNADGEVISSVPTTAEGHYHLTELVAGTYRLVVAASGYQPVTVSLTVADTGELRQDVVLVGAAQLFGAARTRAGRPVPDARITILDKTGNVAAVTHTDAEGGYVLADVSAGDCTVVASGYPPVAVQSRLTAGEHVRHDIELGWEDDV